MFVLLAYYRYLQLNEGRRKKEEGRRIDKLCFKIKPWIENSIQGLVPLPAPVGV
ncbi:MAG: hypothetical protein KME60_15145 [Cyanomargarita calcarea GSE-NOS-MK-12-04C]|jgi:hypothetical protein|uniref:Uncharacterized protein n=1 Tax=Cyanomargarita calcarea GSE-NOS-MK-12-04C TaxID=2839659 RepID=A0A951QLP6_9CYAN|nr:hypothetical protein [Cyanomargarita calcarea GSE-NOS-MK-12-04C]